MLMAEGTPPEMEAIVDMLGNRYLLHSKLHRLSTILVPVDLSDIAENALYFAWQLAEQTGSSIQVLNVIDTVFEGQYAAPAGFITQYKKTLQRDLDDFTHKTLKMLDVEWKGNVEGPGKAEPGKPVLTTVIEYGFPDQVIEEYSRKSDLIVMGMKGKGASLSEKLFGSVSTEVSQHASCPVLFVPQRAAFRGFRTIMYASSFDSLDNLRIRQTVDLARRFKSQLHFVHVLQPSEQEVEKQKQLFELNYRDANKDQPFIFASIPGDSSVMQALREYAFHHRIELMVFVTHQRTAWKDLLHNSVTRQALHSGDVPILVIHSDADMFV
jgi:nucleotide-binding universal stress UspA family protein